MNLKKCINVARAMNDMSMADLAKECNMEASQLYQIRQSESCTSQMLERISRAVGMSVSDFVKIGEEEIP